MKFIFKRQSFFHVINDDVIQACDDEDQIHRIHIHDGDHGHHNNLDNNCIL
jgi:hypothetical protein